MTAAKARPNELPGWPRLLSVELAAAYIGQSPNVLDRLGITFHKVGSRRMYDRADLDRWVDDLAGHSQDGDPQSWMERISQCGT